MQLVVQKVGAQMPATAVAPFIADSRPTISRTALTLAGRSSREGMGSLGCGTRTCTIRCSIR